MLRYVLLSTVFCGNRTYGIGLVEYDGSRPVLIESWPDLSRSVSRVRRFVNACNRLGLDPVHLRDAAEDFNSFEDSL